VQGLKIYSSRFEKQLNKFNHKPRPMIKINGEKGGGQMLRTALTLSTVTGKNFRMTDIRGSRRDPGLKNQHLQAVKMAKKLCDAKTENVEFNSEEITFKPGNLRNEALKTDIGTAGSVNLVLDTLLPVTSQMDEGFSAEISGGTDVRWSPSSLHYEHVKLPLLEEKGLEADYTVKKTGFYPEGGGKAELETGPYSLEELDSTDRGELEEIEVFVKASESLEGEETAEKAVKALESELEVDVLVSSELSYVDSVSDGVVTLLKASYENSVAGFDAVDERGKNAEQNAFRIVTEFNKFRNSEACVDKFMADQLIVFLALVGGEASIRELTDHVETNLSVVEKFGMKVEYEKKEGEVVLRG
jgi:RNA 3'-terminal phosphate cyclase (ATP)